MNNALITSLRRRQIHFLVRLRMESNRQTKSFCYNYSTSTKLLNRDNKVQECDATEAELCRFRW
jgi:hypothetical protein